MRTLSPDTSPAAEAVQIALLREAGDARRAQLCLSMSRTVIELSRRALREQMPGADERTVLLRWASLHYSPTIAAAVARRLGVGT